MRKSFVVAVCLLTAVSARAAVELISPTSISFPVKGSSAKLRVFYTTTEATTVRLTDIGELGAGDEKDSEVRLEAATPVANRVNFLDIHVTPQPGHLPPGDTQTGALVFSGTTTTSFPVTVTRPKPAFTVNVKDTDVCMGSCEPRAIAIEITNTGTTTIDGIETGVIRFSDVSRKHRWVLPSDEKCPEQKKNGTPKRKSDAIPPCAQVSIALQPGQSRTVFVSIDPPPPFAGDYATSIELSVAGAQTATASATVRTRGEGRFLTPFGWFVLIIITGGVLAHILERYFGAGGGQLRARALMSLQATLDELEPIRAWAEKDPRLKSTLGRVTDDMQAIMTILRNAAQKTPGDLDQDAKQFAEHLAKRYVIQRIVRVAETVNKDSILRLDQAGDEGTVKEYEERLEKILYEMTEADTTKTTMAKSPQQLEDERKKERRRLWWQLQLMLAIRLLTLALVSLASAYLALYHNRCSFGSAADYIITFFWALGLTQAGFSIITEGTSRYKPA